MATEAFTVVGKLTLDASQFEKDLQKAEQQAESGQQGTKASTVAWGNVMSSTIQKVGGALLSFGKDTIKTGLDFNASMSKVQALTGANDKQFARMRDTAQEMGRTTVFTATEAADAMGYLAQAGWKTDQIIAGIPGVLSLAASSGTGLAESASIASNAMNAFGMSADEVGHFADLLAVTAGAADTNVSLMGETFKYVAANAGAFNISAADMAESIGLIANAGIKGSNAGTALSRILTNITTNKDAQKAIKDLGVEIFDTSGKMRDWGDIVSDARTAWQGLSSDQEKANFAKSIAGQYGLAAWNALMNTSTESAEQFRAALENSEGAAALMSQGMLDNLKGDLTLLNSAFDGLKLIVSDTFDDQLRSATQSLTDFITGVSNVVKYGFGDTEINALTQGFNNAEKQGQDALTTAVSNGEKAKSLYEQLAEMSKHINDSEGALQVWQQTANQLIGLCPSLASAIDMSTGSFTKSKDAVYADIGAMTNRAKAIALQNVLSEKLTALTKAQQAEIDRQVDVMTKQSEYDARSAMFQDAVRKAYEQNGVDIGAEMASQDASGMKFNSDFDRYVDLLSQLSTKTKDWDESINDAFTSMDSVTQAETALKNAQAAQEGLSQAVATAQTEYSNYATAVGTMINQLTGMKTAIGEIPDSKDVSINVHYNVGSAPSGLEVEVPEQKAKGDRYIPYDNYVARLHRGEMVLTASQARRYRNNETSSGPSAADIGAAVRSALIGMAFVSERETIGRVVGDQTTDRVNRNIGQMSRRHRYGYGG